MPPVEGFRWVAVVFGMPALLLGIVGVAYAGAFVVPGAPCAGGGDISPPTTDVTVASNGSAVTAVHSGGDSIGGETTDRVLVAVDDTETRRSLSVRWSLANGSITEGDSVTLHERDMGFTLSDPDVVTVRWFGVDPDVAGFCPNGGTFGDLTTTQVRNASVPAET